MCAWSSPSSTSAVSAYSGLPFGALSKVCVSQPLGVRRAKRSALLCASTYTICGAPSAPNASEAAGCTAP